MPPKPTRHLFLLSVTLVVLSLVVSCTNRFYGGARFTEELNLPEGSTYFRVFDLNASEVQPYLAQSVDVAFCDTTPYFGAYDDFIRDSGFEYYSVCLYHTGENLPDTRFAISDVRLHYADTTSAPYPWAPLCDETHTVGLARQFCLEPVPIPNGYRGPVYIQLRMTVESESRVS
jgi:hypothetical protein